MRGRHAKIWWRPTKLEIKSANYRDHSRIPSIHVGGSKPFIAHAYDFAKEHNGKLPSLMQQFCLMHHHGEVLCNTKSNALNDMLEQRLGEKNEEAEAAGHDASSLDEDQVFINVVKEYGYLKKGRPYEIGR